MSLENLAVLEFDDRARHTGLSEMEAPSVTLLRIFNVPLIVSFAFLIRVLISVHSYSGAGISPKFGDYEAQRHWMEITLHTPVSSWYKNTTDNDLVYWGLDYPPLTAYQSYLHGLMMNALEPASVALHTSRGYETYSSKVLLRWTVLSSDALLFFPAVLWFIRCFYTRHSKQEQHWALLVILIQPAVMLIDHGHFQYNCISLGLAIGAAAAVVSQKELLACVLFSLSLNHKQMSAYYAPAFFSHLLGLCLRHRYPFFRIIRLGFVVISTFLLCWWPFLHSKGAVLEVLSRLTPLHRGIYEDYVANFWCGTAMLFKWKQLFPMTILARLALGTTVLAFLPSVVQQIWAPSRKGFVFAMLNSSLAFYLFSYQVHEKSILLPVIPATLLVLEVPQVVSWFIPYAMLSMLPLLLRDGLIIPYISLISLFFLLIFSRSSIRQSSSCNQVMECFPFCRWFSLFSVAGTTILHLMYFILVPPVRYPFIFEALIMSYTFGHFLLLAVYTNWRQWSLPVDDHVKEKPM